MRPADTDSITIDDILTTHELERRQMREQDGNEAILACQELGRVLTATPHTLLERLVELAAGLCRAGTAGVSLLESGSHVTGGSFRWIAIAGAYAESIGGRVPAHFSPCGDCLARGSLQLYSRPERVFHYLAGLSPGIAECLVVPLQSPEGLLGSLWIMSHDESALFTSREAAVLKALADITASALVLHFKLDEARAACRADNNLVAKLLHDLRGSLTCTLGWSGMLMAGRASPAEAAVALARIHLNALRQTELIERLAAEMSSGHVGLPPAGYAGGRELEMNSGSGTWKKD